MENDKQIAAIASILGKKKNEKNHDGRRNPKSVQRHVWSIQDEQLAISLYKKNATESEIIEAIKDSPIKLNSMKMKIENVRFLATGNGLENCSASLQALRFDELNRA